MEPWLEARASALSATRLYEGASFPDLSDLDWLIVLGGPMSVNDEEAYPWLEAEKELIARAIEASKVVLGVCLGAQLIASSLGSAVFRNAEREIGWFPVQATSNAAHSPLGALLERQVPVFHWHGETFALPVGATHLATSAACSNQAFSIGSRTLGLQFHLETTRGSAEALIDNCRGDLVPGRWVQSEKEMLRDDKRFEEVNRVMAELLEHLAAQRAHDSVAPLPQDRTSTAG
jgi:GMP synthase-like glutamine amidotransferase